MLAVRSLSRSTERCGSHVKRVMTRSDETVSLCPGTQGDKPNNVWSDLKLGYKPNNVWSDLKHLTAHEHGECGDPWSEL